MNEVVEICIDGVQVEGRVTHRTSADFRVEIVKPYCNLSGGSHIPYFARSRKSFAGEYGDEKIKEELQELYTLGNHLEKEIDSLRLKATTLDAALERVASEMMTDEEIRRKTAESRKQLRKGEIGNKEHQAAVTALREEQEKPESEISMLKDSFFSENFPMVVPGDTQEKILAILRGDSHLQAHRA